MYVGLKGNGREANKKTRIETSGDMTSLVPIRNNTKQISCPLHGQPIIYGIYTFYVSKERLEYGTKGQQAMRTMELVEPVEGYVEAQTNGSHQKGSAKRKRGKQKQQLDACTGAWKYG